MSDPRLAIIGGTLIGCVLLDSRNRSDGLSEGFSVEYLKAKERSEQLNSEYVRASRALKTLSGGGPMNITPDSVRATPEWKKAKRDSDLAFAALREFNEVYTKRFKKEIAQDRKHK